MGYLPPIFCTLKTVNSYIIATYNTLKPRYMACIYVFMIFVFLFPTDSRCQRLSVKTNALYWATGSVNLGGEVGLGKRTTIDFVWGYNNWAWDKETKWKHWLVMPEFRYYFCERFNGHFIGIHAEYSQYNISGVPLLYSIATKDYRYEGWSVGGGISYGYQWILSKRWNMEATVGIGLVYTEYGKFIRGMCGAYLGDDKGLKVVPTKLGLNFIYMIK